MTSSIRLEVQSDDPNSQKWCLPLTEEVFKSFMSREDPTVHIVFGDGSLFNPLLFGKFFDPSDAFPLWDFEPEVLLSKVRKSSQTTVDWSQSGDEYVFRAELPRVGNGIIKVSVEKGMVVEISGKWEPQNVSDPKDWRIGYWWKNGYVRRLELPENADWRKMKAYMNKNDTILEIKIPKLDASA